MMIFKKRFFLIVIVNLFFCGLTFAQSSQKSKKVEITLSAKQRAMKISASDIRLYPENEGSVLKGGYNLYIKKLPGVQSVLLTETSRDPNGKADSYAYRAAEYNPVNGDEIRYLDGKQLVSEGAKYSLVDSTTEKHAELGEAFHIYIPEKMLYGYEWTRHGEVQIGSGTFINIRSFEKPYADYSGEYVDSPFVFNLETRRKPKEKPFVLDDKYSQEANDKFKEFAAEVIYSKGPESIIDDVLSVLKKDDSNVVDIVLAIDATGSMKNDIDKLKKELIPSLQNELVGVKDYRLGLLFYRDYGDSFSYKGLPVSFYPFSKDLASINKNLNALKIIGREGGDTPEAVYEALFASAEYYDWRADAVKKIVLIGDAEPHPQPRKTKKYSKDFVMSVAAAKGITITAILLPADD